MKQLIRVALIAATFALSITSSASAATTIGQTFPPAIDDLPAQLNFMSSTATVASNRAPAAGIVTSFSHHAEMSPDATLTLAIVRETPTGVVIVGLSTPQTLVSGVLGTWKTQLPIAAGDLIGVLGDTDNLAAATPTGDGGDVFRATSQPSYPVGTEIPNGSFGAFNGYIIDIAASVEPDADGDGFGDETQDQCPSDKSTQGPCPDLTAPAVTFKYSKSTKRTSSITFKATPSEAASLKVTGSFKVGKKSYKTKAVTKSAAAGTANSLKVKVPKKVKKAVKAGKTAKGKFKVTATDPAGNKQTYSLRVTLKPSK